MNRIMAICDESPLYAERLAEYANQKGRIPFTAVSFSTFERLQQYLEEQRAEVVLVGQETDGIRLLQKLAGQVITLGDGYQMPQHDGIPSVYKYQSSDILLREVMSLCEAGSGTFAVTATGTCTITGIYSPVNRCGKTAFSLVYGRTLAREGRTLYVNLEDCSGFSCLFPGEGGGDLSDALYYFKQGMLTPVKIAAVIHSMGELDYIPPVRYPEDLSETDAAELGRLLEHLAACGGYHTLVADIGPLGRKAAEILDICDVIYMPVADDEVSTAKVEEFEQYLTASGRGDSGEKIKKLLLPPVKPATAGGSWTDRLLWGEMGDYVRTLVKGGDASWYD